MQAGKLYAATESFLPFEIELSRDYLRPVGFTSIGGMLEQKVIFYILYVMVSLQGGAKGGNFFSPP